MTATAFRAGRFNGWPELKEAYLSGYTPGHVHSRADGDGAARTGVPIKIVYLGHATARP